jgi:hypothetical protein
MTASNQTRDALTVALVAVAVLFTAAISANAANAVVNGDFSSNAALFTAFPGYVGGANPAAIDNWTHAGGNNRGINGVGISTPFGPADQSAATYYALIQGTGGTLSQTITLSANTAYDISFLAANRNGNASASGRVIVADNSTTYHDSGSTVWGTAAFQLVAATFTTPAWVDGSITITLSNDSPVGDNTVCYSDVAIEPVPVGPGSDISDATNQDTPGAERLNVDQTQLNLSAGTYNVDDFRLNVIAHTEGGTITPMLLSGAPSSYTTLWVGSAFDPTSNGDQTVSESGSFTLASATNVYAGFFTAGSGSGIIALDANNSDPGNSSSTDHDANGFTAPTGAGQTVDGISHAGLGRTYAFEINVSVDDGGDFAATGGSSTNDIGGYRIHTFNSSGTFAVTGTGNVEVLVVAGGGGAGANGGGGGGAGGLIYNGALAVNAGFIPVTVGNGGTGSPAGSTRGTSGGNSVFGATTATGGGGGASRDGGGAALAGGSGGGGGGGAAPQITAGAASPAGQGESGGGGYNSGVNSAGGGGGGAGAAGTAGVSQHGGDGGDGVSYSISGTPTAYAGGGGGGNTVLPGTVGLGGTGGGGDGASGGVTHAGNPNTGGGGGGGSGGTGGAAGGDGGSGVVIVRYLLASAAPTVTNQVASGIANNSATFNATLEVASTNVDVYVHWGTTDGTNNATAWASNAYVGSWTNVASTNISLSTNGMASGTLYYYTFRATNDATNVWASPSASFYTHGAPGVDNAGGATGIAVGAATLNGRVVSAGGVALDHVRIYFGDNDGGTDKGNWDTSYVFNAGSVTEGVPFSTNITGLLYGAQYSYRTYASNSYGEAWADEETFSTPVPTVPGGTLGWSYAAWTGDADSGIDSSATYTAAHSFGNNHAGITINGVSFSYSFASSGTGWSIGGTQNNWPNDDDAAITGVSEDLAEEFVYNANPRTVQFSGLTVGTRYRATFFSVGWEATNRIQTFLSSGDSLILDQDFYGDNNGITVSHVFEATGATRDFSITPAGGTFHMYGLANHEVPPVPVEFSITNTTAVNVAETTADLVGTLDGTGSVFDVIAYWSTSNNLTSTAWLNDGTASSAAAGTYTNVTGHSVTGTASLLTGSTLYYYTLVASNAVTNIWASPNASFGTDGRPSVDNAGGATGIAAGGATLNGQVVADGGVALDHVRIYLGDSDGGTVRGDWDTNYAFNAGSISEGVPFSTNITDLLYGVQYSYRTYASNSYGEGWSGVGTFTTLSPEEATPPDGTISYHHITGDADCDIDSGRTYTHKLDFGTGSPGALINGVQFAAYNNGANGTLNFNRAVSSGSLNDHGGNGGHNVSGNLVNLMTDMYYNGGNAAGGTTTWTLSGLTAGTTYDVRIYVRQWGPSANRLVTLVFDPDGPGPISDSTGQISEDDATTAGMAAANDAYYISYVYTAVSGQDLVITATQQNLNNSWHLYGLSNEETPTLSITNTVAANLTTATADLVGTLNAPASVFDVSAYWSATDNPNAAAWLADGGASSTPVGSFTNVSAHSVTGSVGSLTAGERYYYTMVATNVSTNIWASPNAVFYTLYSAAHTPSNLTAQTGIEATIDLGWDESVEHATGFVVEYWKTGGGPTLSLLADSAGGNTTNVTVTGLDHNTDYTFQVAATNSANGDATAFSTTASATTAPEIDPIGGADHRLRITFSSYTGGTLTNFPVLVVFSNGLHGVDYADFESGGTDLRFTGADGVTPVNYEIENWGSGTDKSYVWVQVPEFSGSSVIWAYWGSGKPYFAASQTDGSVWSQDYAGVWHLDETAGVEDLTDSTAFDNDATLDADTDNIDGIVAKAQNFDGGNDYIQIPDSPSVSVTGDLTLSAWIRPDSFVGGSQNIVAKDSNLSYRYRIQDGGTVLWTLIKDAGALETESALYTFETNTWYQAVTKVDFTTQEVSFYINGTEIGTPQVTAKTGINDSAGPLLIGNYAIAHGTEDFIGIIDEVRITDGLRSGDWVSASYLTVASNATFNAYEDAQTLVPNAPRFLIVDGATNVVMNSAYLTASLTSTGGAPTGVWLYWGETNEGDTWGSWDVSSNMGAVVSAPPVPYSTVVSGLTAKTQYYYAYRATNSYGEGWLSEPFKTAGPPEIDNGAGALVDVGIATLRGNLVDTNQAATTVRVYWGPSDGVMDPGAWANTNAMGVLANGAFSTNTPANLLYGVTYYYRCYATNAYGGTWAGSSESFTTPLPREANGWTTSPWNDDATSGITNEHTYTVAVNMKGAQATIGGVSFQAHVLSGPNFTIGGPDSTFNNHVNNVTGDSAVMANDFMHGSGASRTVTLSNLTPGTQYRTTLFGVGFDAAASRAQLFSATGGDAVIQDENVYGQGNGMRQAYTFMADGSGSQAFTVTEQVLNRSFHMYGLANRVVEPLVGIANEDVADVAESTATFKGALSATGAVFDVYVYWGASDGTNNPLVWGDSDFVGSYTNLDTVALSYPATGLAVGTNYYTFRATNALIDMWAEPSETFMSLGQPTIENVAASNAVGYAELKGNLTAGGVANVTVYWGSSDGGTDKTAWGNTNSMGQLLTGTFGTNTSSGLLYGLTYHYRCYATNSIGHDWANSSATFLTVSPSESSGWATNQWNDDATADIDSSYNYNVAVNMSGGAVAVNGVNFLAHTFSGADFSITGLTGNFPNDDNSVIGNSATLANDFRYNGNPGTVVITNLTEGAYYRTTFYGVGFGAAGTRVQTFDAEGDSAVIDEHLYGNNNGMRASYTFRAGASGGKTYTITPSAAPSFHLYALSNRGVPLSEMLEIYNGDVTGLGSDSATFNGTLNASNAVYDVYVYWGTSNPGATPAGWGATNYIGSYTNVAGQALSYPASLSDNTTYYYTFMASNASDVMWAAPSTSLTTLGGPTVTNLPATGVTTASATLNGELLDGTSADVTLYWGLSDAGASAAGWDNTNVISSVTVGTFATTVTVRASGTYYYRCYAANAYGSDWAAPVASFNSGAATLSIADASVPEGDSGTTNMAFDVTLSAACASNVTVNYQAVSDTATVGSDLQSTSGTLQIDAGDSSGQIVAVVIGDLDVEQPSEAFNMNLSSLAGGPSFGDSTAVGTILDEDIGVETARYKMKITFGGYNKVETLTNFPALVMFGTNLSNFGYDQFESPTGGDLRFGNAAETQLLDYEVEEWNVAGQSYIWVKIPELVDSSTYIWGYWGIADDTNAPPSTTNGSVWVADYAAVWHLAEEAGVEDLTDATSNDNDGSDNGDSYNATGVIAGGQRFDTSDGGDYVSVPYSATLGLNTFTVSSWVKLATDPGAGSYGILGTRIGGDTTFDVKVRGTDIHGDVGSGSGWINTSVDIRNIDTGSNGQGGDLAVGDWYLVQYVADDAAKQFRLYIDGDLKRTIAYGGTPLLMKAGQSLWIGDDYSGHEYMNGTLDEVRVSSAARSADWLWANWNNQAQNTSFCNYATVDANPPGATLFIVR